MTDWNQPDSATRLKPWLLIDPLNLFQAVMLIFGRDPSHEITGRPYGYVPIMTALKQAIERGEVPAKRTNNPYEGQYFSLDVEDKTFVQQSDVRSWLQTIGHTDAFFFLANPDAWPNKSGTTPERAHDTDKPLDGRERATLLCIIGALAQNAKLDLSQPMKAGEAIAAMMPDVKLSSRTIGEHLKAVREAMDSRKD